MTFAPAASSQTSRYQAKREAILDAAARLFNQKGLKGATLSDVAQAVGLATNSVTYYHRRKDDLAAACFLRTISTLQRLVDEAQGLETPEARMRGFLDAYVICLADLAEGRTAELVNFYDIRALTGAQGKTVAAAFNALFRSVRLMLRPEAGSPFERPEENARAHLFFAQVLWARTWLRRYDPEDYPRVARRMAELLLQGMARSDSRWGAGPRPAPSVAVFAADEVSQATYLRAATQLINEQGYHGASVNRIAARLNVTKGSFYHHNDTKDDLVVSGFRHSFAVVRSAQRRASGGDAWTRLTSVVDGLVRYQLSPQGPLLQYMALAAAPEAVRGDLLASMDRLSQHFAGEIADGVADGSIRPVDPAIAAQLVTGAINAAADLPRWTRGLVTADTVSQLFVRPLFHGVLAAP